MIKNFNPTYCEEMASCDFCFGNIDSEYGVNPRYFTMRGKPWLPIFGEFHFSRYEAEGWQRELAKMKAQGLDGVSVYIFWSHHEYEEGKFDFSGNYDIAKFLALCKNQDMKVILRIGPWCHGEARYGGFPDYLQKVKGKRSNNPKYLGYVKRYWQKIADRVEPFCDGKTIIGLQMENEYSGKMDHIVKLREIAEEVGFRIPFFTMTAWPTNSPSKYFLPMFGGYPEAPWTWHKKPLTEFNRFVITSGRAEAEIGEDLIKVKRGKADFSNFPYSGCEVGTGNQVTQHRRPIISDNDGYGVAFAKFASGMNLMGYYMYHGGRNPEGRLLQESRKTLYPNNYQIVDYDFQAPISKDGKVRKHADRLRLMHYFTKHFDSKFALTQAFFPNDAKMPYSSLRSYKGSGYVFISNYERGKRAEDAILDIVIDGDGVKHTIVEQFVLGGAMFFFPYSYECDGVNFDYITAQPIIKDEKGGSINLYFMRTGEVRISQNKIVSVCDTDTLKIKGKSKEIVLHFLDEDKALDLYYIDGKVNFSEGCLYKLNGELFEEKPSVELDKSLVSLKETAKIHLPYNSYLYSHAKRRYFKLTIDNKLLTDFDDCEVTLAFRGLNLQIFHGTTLVDDCFNTDGKCVFNLGRLKKHLANLNFLIIKAVPSTSCGVGKVYNEIDMKAGELSLSVEKVVAISKNNTRL